MFWNLSRTWNIFHFFFFVYSLNFEDADKNNEKGKNINWVRLSSADRDENFPLQLLTSVLVLFFFRKKKKKMRWCFIMFWWKDNRNDIRRPWPAPRNPLRWCFKKDEKVGNHQLVEANRSVAATVTNSCEITNIRCWPPHAWPSLSLIFGKDFSLISIDSKLLSLDHYLPSIPIDVNFRSWVISPNSTLYSSAV